MDDRWIAVGSRGWRRPDVAAGVVLCVIYAITVAPGVTYWDAGEFLASIHALGIPHPPGTPLYVLLARVWSMLTAPVLGFALAVNMFSAVCTALSFGLLANRLWRWTGHALASFAAAICAGSMSTVWLNATETEVYSVTLLTACCILWTADQARRTGDRRWLWLTGYIIGLGWALHLMALLVVPAALVLVAQGPWIVMRDGAGNRRRAVHLLHLRDFGIALLLALLGASAVLFLFVRAQHDPAINQGNPVTWSAMWDVITRAQYGPMSLWPRQAPWWLQIANVAEYADWQTALGLAPDPPPVWSRTLITLAFVLAGVVGCIFHRRADRPTWRAAMMLLITGSLGVVTYLNLKAGPSFGYGIIPDGAVREARERDYFFTFAFVCWGMWAGYGLVKIAQQLVRLSWRRIATIGAVAAASVPIILNWPVVQHERRDGSRIAMTESLARLRAVPQRGVFLAAGDNDTYPLWYLQEVHGIRTDVIVVTLPLLGPSWYRQELARRHGLLSDSLAGHWRGVDPTLKEIRHRAAMQGRAFVVSPVFDDDPL